MKRLAADSREILEDIRRLVQAIRLASADSEKVVGLTAAQLFVLHKVGDEKGLSINELAEKTLTHQSSVSVVVAKLESKGFIQKVKSQEDGRRYTLSLTKKGINARKKAPHAVQDKLIGALAKMEPDMRHMLSESFTAFLNIAGIKGHAPMIFDELTQTKKNRKQPKKKN